MSRYILIAGSPEVCWRGEGSKSEIRRDIHNLLEKGYPASSMTILPVSGSRYHVEVGVLIGTILGATGMWLYKKLRKNA